MRTTAVIPCHNEAKTIGGVVRQTLKHVDRVIVVDNLSTDGTAEVAAEVVGWPNIVGSYLKGAGHTTGLGMAYAMNPIGPYFADAIVTLDGDGQHDPDDIPRLLLPLFHDTADIVIGSRFLCDFDIARYRKLGIDVITWLYNVGFREKLTDGQSCMRAFSRKTVKPLIPTEVGFGFSTEMLVKARTKHWRMIEVPIRCIYHETHAENSTLNPVSHGLSVAWKTVKWRLKEEVFK